MEKCFFRFAPIVLMVMLANIALSQQRFNFDPERFFILGDADIDGRMSLQEYQEFMKQSPRFRGDPEGIKRFFQRIDTDGNGFLSLSEYIKTFAQRRPPNSTQESKPTTVSPHKITNEQRTFFEKKIRPVLENRCVECHSGNADEAGAHFYVDSREGLIKGGDSGAAIIPGNPARSLLIQAIQHSEGLQMPPDEKLAEAVVEDFKKWVVMGAPDPRTDRVDIERRRLVDLEKAKRFWSFQIPKKTAAPIVKNESWPRSDIDRFLLADLEKRGLSPVADAPRRRLLRRAFFDLIGLPPSPHEIKNFLSDKSPKAFEKVVDQLLATEQFGERWGRHWLDVARYGESTGKTNFNFPQAWRYRDWVIDSFNADKPYDQFVREQIAGDLLPSKNESQRSQRLIATTFLAMGSKALDNLERDQFVLDLVDEQIDVTTRAFLGLTVTCARCHDHKVDPISQQDYYALAGIFRSTRTCYGTLQGVFPNFNGSTLIELPEDVKLPSGMSPLSAEQRSRMQSRLTELLSQRAKIPRGQANRDQMRRITSQISSLRYRLLVDRPDESPRVFTMGVQERVTPRNSPLYIRGELEKPGRMIPRGLISVFKNKSTKPVTSGSGRKELADWLASPDNPLTARVMVNRVWQHLFGRGLVATPDNFGNSGARPSHPELLDRLAVDFRENGWSIKKLIKKIVLSRGYGLDSAYNDDNFDKDPDNEFVWRMSKKRLEGEVIRDSMLCASGELESKRPIGSLVARAGEGFSFLVRSGQVDITDRHRSVYLPVVRDRVAESLSLFDFADASLVTGKRSTTTGPAQALYFMNGALVTSQADALARRVVRFGGDTDKRIVYVYQLVLSRDPTTRERNRAKEFMKEFQKRNSENNSKELAWSAFCQALFASAEFRYLD